MALAVFFERACGKSGSILLALRSTGSQGSRTGTILCAQSGQRAPPSELGVSGRIDTPSRMVS